jgi:hypothetical protein
MPAKGASKTGGVMDKAPSCTGMSLKIRQYLFHLDLCAGNDKPLRQIFDRKTKTAQILIARLFITPAIALLPQLA